MIRLEKGACSYMNRSIMSKGAFAVLYGQHLKCYIRDPEVVLSIIFLSSKYDTPKIKKLHDILDLDCPNFLSFNLQIDKYVEKYFDWPHDKSTIRIIMRRTFLNSMTSAIILLLKFIVKLVCSYYRCANV